MEAGSFGAGAFPLLLRALMRRRATGRLDVLSSGELRQLWLHSGTVRAVISEVETEKLGKWLVSEGVLEPARMALALLRQPDGVRFGAFLVQEGMLDSAGLSGALESLATAIVASLLLPPGHSTFVAGDALPADAVTIEMTTASLLVAAVRRVADAGELELLLPGDSYPTCSQDAMLLQQRVQLTPQEAYLLSRVDGSATVSTLRRVMPLPRDAMTRCLAALVLSGMADLRIDPGLRPAVLEVSPAPAPAREAEKRDGGVQFTPEQQREYEEVVRLALECQQRDFFRRLGLSQGATLNQVHERYRELGLVYHPDRTREVHLRGLRRELAEIHDAIQEAYETLINPEKRARYAEGLKTNTLQTPEEQIQDDRRQRARRELARANMQRAQTLVRAGDFGAAVQLLDESVRAEPNSESLLLLARLEQRNPMWTKRVLEHLRQAVTMDPQYTEAWLELAAFWGKKGQPERQRQCLEKILAYDSAHAEAARLLGGLKARK